jgi:hypothetical protein
MQVGNRVLVLLLVIGLIGCGGLGTAPEDEVGASSSTITSETSAPVEAEDPVATTTADSGEDSNTTTLVTQATPTTTLDEPPVTTTTQGTSGQYDPAFQSYVDQAIADLAHRLGTNPSSVSVISAEAVVWPDAGLGCPEPGMVYTQVQVDGLLIRLSADDNEYRYHTGGRVSTPFLCENPE